MVLSYFKNNICKFMQTNSSHHKLFHFHFSFWIWILRKRSEKLQKFEYLENKKSFFDEIEIFFYNFWRAIIWWKIKIWKKIVDTSFKFMNQDWKWLISSAVSPVIFLFRKQCINLYKGYSYKLYTKRLSSPSCRESCIYLPMYMRYSSPLLVI